MRELAPAVLADDPGCGPVQALLGQSVLVFIVLEGCPRVVEVDPGIK